MRVLAAVVSVFVLAVPSWGAQPRRATLELRSLAPLAVRGLGFGAGEQVVVTATFAGKQHRVDATARRNGRFVVRFEVRLERCTPVTIRAIGALGSRAILQREPGCKKGRKNR